MKINQFLSFKSNIESKTPQETSAVANSAVTNPISQTPAPIVQSTTATTAAAVPTYNVKTPLKYSKLGVENLPCDTKAHFYKLENGQKVVIIPKEGSTVVKTYVNTGSMNEPDNVRGISHFIEHNLFNGSEGLEAGEFFKTVNKLGASTNASTGFAATDYFISSHLLKKNDLETEIKIHAEMLESPRFALDMLEKEKGPVTSEINMILDDPENVATNNTLKTLYNIKSTSKDIIGGTVDNINNLTREDVSNYYQRNYYPANMVTVITGEIEPEKTMELIAKNFHSKAQPNKPRNFEELKPLEKTVRNDIISDKATSTIVSIGFNGPKNNDTKGKILLDAFQFFLLGSSVSRLNKSLEKIQSNAMVSSDRISTKPEDGRVILFSTQTSEKGSENVIKTIFREIASLEQNPPTDQELNIVKKKLKLNVAEAFESSDMINSIVGTSMLDNDLGSVTKFNEVIDNMTSKEMVDFAKKYFDLNKVAITVVHPSSATAQTIADNHSKANSNVAFTGAPDEINHKEAINLSKVKKYGITNNLMVATNDTKTDLATFDLSLVAPIPADVQPGVSELLSIMLNRGSNINSEKEFFTNLENKGISTNFSATERGIFVNSSFLPSDGVNALKSAKEVVLNPRFTDEELKYAKNVLKENLQNVPKNSSEGLLKELFKDQFYGVTSSELLNNIDRINLNDIKGLYAYIIKNAQGDVAISAPFEKNPNLKDELMNELCTEFPTLKPNKPALFDGFIPIQDKKVVLQEHNKSQAEIQMGYKFKTNGNLKDDVTFGLMNMILGGNPSSRLFSDLREKQKLAYQVNSKIGFFDNSGVLSLYIKTTTDDVPSGKTNYDNLKKSIVGFENHVQKMVTENVTSEELENAKLSLKNKILNSTELTADKNASILNGLASFNGIEEDNKVLDLIDKITVNDIKAAANYVFSSKPVTSIVATKNTLENNKNYLNSLGTVVG